MLVIQGRSPAAANTPARMRKIFATHVSHEGKSCTGILAEEPILRFDRPCCYDPHKSLVVA